MDLSDDDVSPTSDVEDVSETHSKKIFEYVKLPNDDEYSDNENDDGSYTDSNEDYQSEPEQLNNMSIDPIVDVKSEPYDEDDDTAQYDETSESGTDTHNTDMYDFDAEHDPEAPQQKHSVTTRDMAEKRKDPKRLVCNFCKEIFIGKEVLEAHYKKKHTGIGKPFECKECGMSFKYMSVLRVHMRKHTGEKPFSCTLCDKTFCQKAYLDAHLKRHNGDKLYLCDECNKTFITQAHLKRHLVTHIQGKTFICTECGEEGPSETCQSEQHSRAYFEERPFVCQICDKRFSMHSAMINHSRTHTGEKPFSCELCQKTFTQRSNLSVHMKTHTGEKKFKCQFCDIAYLYKVNLDRHIRRAHGENSSYTCKECGESFSWRSSLHLHVLSHTGKDPFQCDYCDKKYVLQKCLWVHMRTHSGSVDFKCKVCDEHFKHHSELRKHMKTHKSKKSQVHAKETTPTNQDNNASLKDDQLDKSHKGSDSVQKLEPDVSYQNEKFDGSIQKIQPNVSYQNENADLSFPKTQSNANLYQNKNVDFSVPKTQSNNLYQNGNVDFSIQKPKSNICYQNENLYLHKDPSQISRTDFYNSLRKK